MTRGDLVLTVVVVCVLTVALLLICSSFFRLPTYKGELRGRIGGREGFIVSTKYPGDLWVEINVPANDEEKQAQLEAYLADDGWKGHEESVKENVESMRSWVGGWRWNVEIWEESRITRMEKKTEASRD